MKNWWVSKPYYWGAALSYEDVDVVPSDDADDVVDDLHHDHVDDCVCDCDGVHVGGCVDPCKCSDAGVCSCCSVCSFHYDHAHVCQL